MLTEDAHRYLRESKASVQAASARAVDEPRAYWHAWAAAFAGRVRSLERLIARMQEQPTHADAR